MVIQDQQVLLVKEVYQVLTVVREVEETRDLLVLMDKMETLEAKVLKDHRVFRALQDQQVIQGPRGTQDNLVLLDQQGPRVTLDWLVRQDLQGHVELTDHWVSVGLLESLVRLE